MEIILYLSAAVIAIAFLVLVIYLAKTLKTLQETLTGVTKTLSGLEKQLDGVTSETTLLLQKTNALAEDMQEKSESLNSVVAAVKDVGSTVKKFNGTLKNLADSFDVQVDQNKEKVSQIVQWSNVLLELKDKWNERKQEKKKIEAVEPEMKKGQIQIGQIINKREEVKMSSREYDSRETGGTKSEESSGSFLLGLLVGGLAGAAAAVLFSQKSGREIRHTINNQAGSLMEKTVQLRDNVLKTKAKNENVEDTKTNYISLDNPGIKTSSSPHTVDETDIRKKLEEAKKAFDEEENKVTH